MAVGVAAPRAGEEHGEAGLALGAPHHAGRRPVSPRAPGGRAADRDRLAGRPRAEEPRELLAESLRLELADRHHGGAPPRELGGVPLPDHRLGEPRDRVREAVAGQPVSRVTERGAERQLDRVAHHVVRRLRRLVRERGALPRHLLRREPGRAQHEIEERRGGGGMLGEHRRAEPEPVGAGHRGERAAQPLERERQPAGIELPRAAHRAPHRQRTKPRGGDGIVDVAAPVHRERDERDAALPPEQEIGGGERGVPHPRRRRPAHRGTRGGRRLPGLRGWRRVPRGTRESAREPGLVQLLGRGGRQVDDARHPVGAEPLARDAAHRPGVHREHPLVLLVEEVDAAERLRLRERRGAALGALQPARPAGPKQGEGPLHVLLRRPAVAEPRHAFGRAVQRGVEAGGVEVGGY